jgi:hypothetical protein
MKKLSFLWAAALAVCTLLLAGCGEKPGEYDSSWLIGSWNLSTTTTMADTIHFDIDGSLNFTCDLTMKAGVGGGGGQVTGRLDYISELGAFHMENMSVTAGSDTSAGSAITGGITGFNSAGGITAIFRVLPGGGAFIFDALSPINMTDTINGFFANTYIRE